MVEFSDIQSVEDWAKTRSIEEISVFAGRCAASDVTAAFASAAFLNPVQMSTKGRHIIHETDLLPFRSRKAVPDSVLIFRDDI